MTKKLLIASLLIAIITPIQAATMGMGGNVDRNTTLRFPIFLKNSIIEPYMTISYRKTRDNDQSSFDRDLTTERNTIIVGIGAFKTRPTAKANLTAYYGARLGYFTGAETGASKDQYQGYEFVPTLGISYNFFDVFSLALEHGLTYQNTIQKTRESSSNDGETDTESLTSLTQVVIRVPL